MTVNLKTIGAIIAVLTPLGGGVGWAVHQYETHNATVTRLNSEEEWLRYDSAEILWLRGYELNLPRLGPEPQMREFISDLKPNQEPTATMP